MTTVVGRRVHIGIVFVLALMSLIAGLALYASTAGDCSGWRAGADALAAAVGVTALLLTRGSSGRLTTAIRIVAAVGLFLAFSDLVVQWGGVHSCSGPATSTFAPQN